MKKRFVSVILALCMVLGMVPLKAFAAESGAFAEPKVTQLTVSYDGGEPVDLLGNQPTISMPAGSKPVFTVTFDSTELLNKVFVTSTKDGETKYLEATLQDGKYVTDSYFDPNDTSYIPGTIAVTYSKKTLKIDESGNIGGTDLNALKTQLTAQGVSSRNEATGADGTVTAEIVLGDMFGAMANVYFDAAVSEFTAGAGIDQSELDRWLGVYQNLSKLSTYDLEGADGKKFTLYLGDGKDFGDPDTYLVMVKDITSNKYTRTLLQKAANMANLGDISDAMDAAKLTSGKLLEYRAISKDTAALREEIEAHPTMTAQEKAEANAKIDALDRDKRLFLIGMTAISLLTAPAGTPLMISALVTGYSTMADYFWEKRVGLIKGCDPIENVFSENNDHGVGWTALTNDSVDEGSDVITIKENGQYFMVDDVYRTIYIGLSEGGTPVNATICLHGHQNSSVIIRGHSTLRICDCKYNESEDGTVVGGEIKVNAEKGNKLILDSGIIREGITINDGEIEINGGMVTHGLYGADCPVYSKNGGKITINGGIIEGGVCAKNGGEIVINNGSITGSAYINHISDEISGYASIWTDNAKIVVNNGKITGTGGTGICNERGEIIINNVTILNSEESGSHPGIWNYHGTVTVKDGTIGRIVNENGTVNIHGGRMENYVAGVSNQAGGTVNITGGEIKGTDTNSDGIKNDGGIINIKGGLIKGDSRGDGLDNGAGGVVTISGGEIQGGYGLTNSGKTTITGGTIKGNLSGAISNASGGEITISGGTIIGNSGIMNHGTGKVNLAINQNSDILVDGGSSKAFWLASGASSIPTSVAAAEGYTSGVTYYSSADAQGVPMTIEQAAAMDFNQSYIRLVASGAVSGNDKVTVTPSTGGNVTFAPNDPADGDTVTITVTPDSGYQGGAPVVKDSDGNTIPVTDAGSGKYTFVKPAGQVTITAPEFTRPTYSVTAPASTPNGSVTLDTSTAHEGDTVTITVTPNAGYQGGAPVVKDADGNTLAITDAGNGKYTFVMPAKNVVVTAAEFTPTSYTITGPSKPSNGTVSLSAATAHKGDTVTITVTPDINFTAKTPVVTGAGGNVAVTKVSDTTYTFVMPEGNVTVDASFSVINFTLAYTPYASMTDADKKLYYGGKLEITGLVPNTKYVVTFDNGLAAPKQVNGRNVIPRIAHVVTSDAAGKVALGCQDSMNVMVFGVSSGGNVTTDLVELYAKNHAGVPVSGLASKGSGT